jgi:hypothetical protein
VTTPLAVMEAVAEVLCPGERIALLDRIIDLHKSRRPASASTPGAHDHENDEFQPYDTLMAESQQPTHPRHVDPTVAVGGGYGWGHGPPSPPPHFPQHHHHYQVMRRPLVGPHGRPLLIAAGDARPVTWCCIQKPCINTGYEAVHQYWL